MVPLMLVLLISAAPVALPVMLAVSMAAGTKGLAKGGVLVTRLGSISRLMAWQVSTPVRESATDRTKTSPEPDRMRGVPSLKDTVNGKRLETMIKRITRCPDES
jgi:hypothetical protein